MAFMNANWQNHIFINLQERYSNQNLISIEENNSICLQNNISPPSITLKRQ